jgi:glutamyl-tRNA reductase
VNRERERKDSPCSMALQSVLGSASYSRGEQGFSLLYVGLTHDTAPLNVRERTRPTLEQQREMLDRLGALAAGRMVLSTCERFEVYAATRCVHPDRWISLLADWFHLPRRIVSRYARFRCDHDAALHLLRVAAGLESRVLGEPQVLGQVRQAYAHSLKEHAMNPVLAALGRTALRAGRRARHETPINRRRISIATIAVDELGTGGDRSTDAINRTMLIVGSGRMAADVLAEARSRRAGLLTIVARNFDRATELAGRFGASVVPLAQLTEAMADTDSVVVCTSAPGYVVDAAAVGQRRGKRLDIIDLCVPRNVDPVVEHVAGVRLTDLDALLSRRMERGDGPIAAMQIVNEELSDFLSWCRCREAAPLIATLVREAERTGAATTLEDRRWLHGQILRIKSEFGVCAGRHLSMRPRSGAAA